MSTEYTKAKATLDSLLAARGNDQARQNLCEQQIRNKVQSHSGLGWAIFCAWEWLEQHHAENAHAFCASLPRPEQLQTCVHGHTETLRRERVARRGVHATWPEWRWDFGEYTPEKFSIGLLEKLAVLARLTPGSGWIIAREVRSRTITRLRTSRSRRGEVVVRDVQEIIDEVRTSRVYGSGSGSRRSSREIEQGRGSARPLSDRSSTTLLPLGDGVTLVRGGDFLPSVDESLRINPVDDSGAQNTGGATDLDLMNLDFPSFELPGLDDDLPPPPPPSTPSPPTSARRSPPVRASSARDAGNTPPRFSSSLPASPGLDCDDDDDDDDDDEGDTNPDERGKGKAAAKKCRRTPVKSLMRRVRRMVNAEMAKETRKGEDDKLAATKRWREACLEDWLSCLPDHYKE